MNEALRAFPSRVIRPLARILHRADFAWVLPALARLPIGLGHRLAALRGRLNAVAGRDWRSMGLGFRHIRAQSALGYRSLPLQPSAQQVRTWVRERFVAEARDEYEARLVAAGRVDELRCEMVPGEALSRLMNRERGLVLLTPHFESFFLGVAFLARSGVKLNLMTSAVTHDPRVDAAVQSHFTAKYRGLERFLNGGKAVDLELGSRQFYRMLQNKEALVVLGDAPVLPEGAAMTVDFLGGTRRLSGGAVRMAQSTGSDVGGFICRHLGGSGYRLELGPIGPAADPAAIAAVYGFFSQAILAHPGGWWAADLLPNMPLATPGGKGAP
jgi:lauroyl/myristoyl acyltransferase